MSRAASNRNEVLADLLVLDAVNVRCGHCERSSRVDTGRLLSRLAPLDWITPLDEAATHLRCSCGARQASIETRRRAVQQRLQLVDGHTR